MSVDPAIIANVLDKALVAIGTLGGVFVSSIIEHRRIKATRTFEQRKILLSKLEELTEAVADSLRWLSAVTAAKSLEEVRALAVPMAARRVHALTMVYFEPLQASAESFSTACTLYVQLFLEVPDDATVEKMLSYAVLYQRGRYDALTRAVHVARHNLDVAMATHAKRLLTV